MLWRTVKFMKRLCLCSAEIWDEKPESGCSMAPLWLHRPVGGWEERQNMFSHCEFTPPPPLSLVSLPLLYIRLLPKKKSWCNNVI